MEKNFILSIIVIIISLFGCTDKFDSNLLTNSNIGDNINFGDTLYIQQNPVWEGFNKPEDILVGREPFIYVADTENDRIVMLNLGGQVLGSLNVKRPTAIAQDYRLDLIICAQFDTLINNEIRTYSAVYKINLVEVGHIIENAKLIRLLPKTSFDFSRTNREYTGVAVFYDNTFLISRRGPVNVNLIDPDNSILIFQSTRKDGIVSDSLTGRVPLLEPQGTGLLSANNISSITSFNRRSYDLIVTISENNSFKAQWFEYLSTPDFSGYVNKITPGLPGIMSINKFLKPEDAAIDNSNNIFIVDAEKDSVFKFNQFGDELQSFGGSDIFNNPHGLAYFDRTLYIADTDNNRILRFILSTEIF